QFGSASLLQVEFLALCVQGFPEGTKLFCNLLHGTRLPVNAAELLFKGETEPRNEGFGEFGSRRVQDRIGCVEHLPKEVEFLTEYLEGQALSFVTAVEEAQDGHGSLLPVAVHTTDPLFDPLRVPGEIVIDQGFAELEVQSFGSRFGRNEHL